MHGSMGGGRKPAPVGTSARSQAPLAYPTNLAAGAAFVLAQAFAADGAWLRLSDSSPGREPRKGDIVAALRARYRSSEARRSECPSLLTSGNLGLAAVAATDRQRERVWRSREVSA